MAGAVSTRDSVVGHRCEDAVALRQDGRREPLLYSLTLNIEP